MMTSIKNLKIFFLQRISCSLPIFLIVYVLLVLTASLQPTSEQPFRIGGFVLIFSLLKAFCIALLCSLLSVNRIIKWSLILVHVLTFEFYLYLSLQFQVRLTPNVLALILQTDNREAGEFFASYFSVKMIALLSFVFLFSILVFKVLEYVWDNKGCGKKLYKILDNKIASCICSLGFIISLWSNFLPIHLPKYTLPPMLYATTMPLNDLYHSYREIGGGNLEKCEKIFNANENLVVKGNNFDGDFIILVIGESHIKNHSSLYGYPHETNPYMRKEQNKGNLFVFNDVVTPYSETGDCMKLLFSTKSFDDKNVWEDMPLFPAVFKKAGFECILLDNQTTRSKGGGSDYRASFFFSPLKIHNQCFDYRNEELYEYDADIITNEFKAVNISSRKPKLIIVHLNGQHVDAAQRYPNKDFTYFSTDSIRRRNIKDESKLLQIAHYDNATRYNDYVLHNIIEKVRDKDAIMLYLSDHGECIMDDSKLSYGRSISTNKSDEIIKTLYEIPMWLWCSDKYIKNHEEQVLQIKESQAKPFMSDDIAHLLFDIGNIHGSFFNETRSVINKKYKSHDRYVNSGAFNYDSNKDRLNRIVLRADEY